MGRSRPQNRHKSLHFAIQPSKSTKIEREKTLAGKQYGIDVQWHGVNVSSSRDDIASTLSQTTHEEVVSVLVWLMVRTLIAKAVPLLIFLLHIIDTSSAYPMVDGPRPAPAMKNAFTATIRVSNAGVQILNGTYKSRPYNAIPESFADVCHRMKWDPQRTWTQLAAPSCRWFLHDNNASYIYLHNDGRFWMDDPNGAGIYVCDASNAVELRIESGGGGGGFAEEEEVGTRILVPSADAVWKPLSRDSLEPMPIVTVVERESV